MWKNLDYLAAVDLARGLARGLVRRGATCLVTLLPQTRAPYDPGEATTCVPSDAYVWVERD